MNKYPDRTSKVRSKQENTTDQTLGSRRLPEKTKSGTLEGTWGGYLPQQGYLKVPDAIACGQVLVDFKLPPAALPVLIAAHKHISLAGEQWISRNDIMRWCPLGEAAIRRALQACHRASLTIKRQPEKSHGRKTEYRFDGLYEYLRKISVENDTNLPSLSAHPDSKRPPVSVISDSKKGPSGGPLSVKNDTNCPHFSGVDDTKSAILVSFNENLASEVTVSGDKNDTKIAEKQNDFKGDTRPLHRSNTYIQRSDRSDFHVDTEKDPPPESPKPKPPPRSDSPLADYVSSTLQASPSDAEVKVNLFREIWDDSTARQILDSCHANSEDLRSLCRDALNKGLGSAEIISALQAAVKHKAGNPVGYARTCLKNTKPKLVIISDRDRDAAEERRLEQQKLEQAQWEREQAEQVLAQPAYAEVREFISNNSLVTTSVISWMENNVPKPDVLLEALETAKNGSQGQTSSFMFGLKFYEALRGVSGSPAGKFSARVECLS